MPKLRILLDECLDRRLAKKIPQHFVKTVPEMGWAGMKNGELLAKAQEMFDIFLTNDQNLSFQQNLPNFKIAVLILCPKSNRLQDLYLILPKVMSILGSLKTGKVIFVKH